MGREDGLSPFVLCADDRDRTGRVSRLRGNDGGGRGNDGGGRGCDGVVVIERLEELELGGEVLLTRLVEVEVVVGEAGEDGDLCVDLVGSVEFEGNGS